MSYDPHTGSGGATPPAASVIIAAYQAADFVQAAVHSALSQTLEDIEVIVVDDGSTDGTWDAILACAEQDARVVPIRQFRWAGPSAARNAGIARARGRWLAVLDADDLYVPHRLERMVAAGEALGADLVADNMLQVDFATGEPLGSRLEAAAMACDGPVRLIDAVRQDMPGSTPKNEMFGFFQPIIRRAFLVEHGIRYSEDLLVGEDFLLYAECMARGGRFHLVPDAYYVQRVRRNSLSTRRGAMLHLSAANRRIVEITAGSRDAELAAVLRERQRLIDIDCFALLLEQGEVRAALKHAHLGSPSRVLRHARAAVGAVRRRVRARAAMRPAGPIPVPVPVQDAGVAAVAQPATAPERDAPAPAPLGSAVARAPSRAPART